jgi:hypothetical protein
LLQTTPNIGIHYYQYLTFCCGFVTVGNEHIETM